MLTTSRLDWDISIEKKQEIGLREYESIIKTSCSEFIEKEKGFLTIIEYPSSQKMSKIIDRAVRKKKPFFHGKTKGSKGKSEKTFSDAGFKDTVFLESIIEAAENDMKDFIIVTNDKYFKEIELEKELNNAKGEVLEVQTGIELVEYLKKRFSIEDLSKHIGFIKSDYFKQTIENKLSCTLIELCTVIEKMEVELDTIVYVKCKIELKDETIDVIVKLTEENDFLEVIDAEKNEVIFEWVD